MTLFGVANAVQETAEEDASAGETDDEHGAEHLRYRTQVYALELFVQRVPRRAGDSIVFHLGELQVQGEGEGRDHHRQETEDEHERDRVLLATPELECVDYEEGDRHDRDVGADVQYIHQNCLLRLGLRRAPEILVNAPVDLSATAYQRPLHRGVDEISPLHSLDLKSINETWSIQIARFLAKPLTENKAVHCQKIDQDQGVFIPVALDRAAPKREAKDQPQQSQQQRHPSELQSQANSR
jgi:hypothetical protein